MNHKLLLIFFTLAFSNFLLAEDFSQSLGGRDLIKEFEEDEEYRKEETYNHNDTGKAFVGGAKRILEFEKKLAEDQAEENLEESIEDEERKAHVPGSVPENFFPPKTKNDISGAVIDGGFDHVKGYQLYKNSDILSEKFNKSEYSYSFTMIKDTYVYDDDRGAYKKTFEDSEKGHKIGGFHIEYRNYISKGWANTHWGMGFGIGHSRGKGLFQDDSSISRVTFQVWTFPIDLWMGMEIPIGQVLKLSFAGGPSALPILQTRNDRSKDDSDKEYHQIGTGFSGIGKLQFNLTRISSSTGFTMRSNYDISDFYMNLVARYQSYDNFKDNITVTGASFGIGFTFEYL